MAFNTRPKLDNDYVEQNSTHNLTLSGVTDFVGTLKIKGVEFDIALN